MDNLTSELLFNIGPCESAWPCIQGSLAQRESSDMLDGEAESSGAIVLLQVLLNIFAPNQANCP